MIQSSLFDKMINENILNKIYKGIKKLNKQIFAFSTVWFYG